MKVFYPSYTPIMTLTTPLNIGVSVDGTPSGNVDISITGDYCNTVNQTITAQQAQDGYCFSVFGNVSNGRIAFTVTVTASGGISESKQFTAYVSDETIEEPNTKWTAFMSAMDGYANWRREYPSLSNAQIETVRQQLKDQIYIPAAPSGAPNTISNNPSSYGGVTLANAKLATSKRVDFVMNDLDGYSWTQECTYITNTDNTNTLFIDFFGHGEAGHQNLYNALMAEGYDYAMANLPSITTNPNVVGVDFWASRHNAIYLAGIDRVGFNGLLLFVFDKIRLIDYALSQKAYTKIVIAGASGGGHLAGLIAALDTRVQISFNCRGAYSQGTVGAGSEFEYAAERTFNWLNETNCGPRQAQNLRDITRFTWWMLACNGTRQHHNMQHILDAGGYYVDLWRYDLIDYAQSIGCNFNFVRFTNPLTATHGYQTDDINYIIDNL